MRRPAAPHRRRRAHDEIEFQVGSFSLTKKGAKRFDWRDPYHIALTLGWPHFFLTLLAVDLSLNLVFALLYWLSPGAVLNAHPGSFADCFFFSNETLATVGYGVMAPGSTYGHVVSTVEILCGMIFTAISTGLIFVRFSKPRAKILFAEDAVIARDDARATLMIRLGNGRLSLLADATARLSVLIIEQLPDGRLFRHFHDLPLRRHRMPIFALTWTLMHEIDEASPLIGYDADRLAASSLRIILLIEARDHALGTQVHAMKDYDAPRIRYGMRYQEAVTVDAEGHSNADLTRIGLIEPDMIASGTVDDIMVRGEL